MQDSEWKTSQTHLEGRAKFEFQRLHAEGDEQGPCNGIRSVRALACRVEGYLDEP